MPYCVTILLSLELSWEVENISMVKERERVINSFKSSAMSHSVLGAKVTARLYKSKWGTYPDIIHLSVFKEMEQIINQIKFACRLSVNVLASS